MHGQVRSTSVTSLPLQGVLLLLQVILLVLAEMLALVLLVWLERKRVLTSHLSCKVCKEFVILR